MRVKSLLRNLFSDDVTISFENDTNLDSEEMTLKEFRTLLKGQKWENKTVTNWDTISGSKIIVWCK